MANLPLPARLALRPIRRAPRAFLPSFFAAAGVIFCLGLGLAGLAAGEGAAREIDARAALALELRPGAQDFEIENLQKNLENLDFVRATEFLPRQKALENFRARHPELGEILDENSLENPLPSVVFVRTDSPGDHPRVQNFLKNSAALGGLIAENSLKISPDSAENFAAARRRAAGSGAAAGLAGIFLAIAAGVGFRRAGRTAAADEAEVFTEIGAPAPLRARVAGIRGAAVGAAGAALGIGAILAAGAGIDAVAPGLAGAIFSLPGGADPAAAPGFLGFFGEIFWPGIAAGLGIGAVGGAAAAPRG